MCSTVLRLKTSVYKCRVTSTHWIHECFYIWVIAIKQVLLCALKCVSKFMSLVSQLLVCNKQTHRSEIWTIMPHNNIPYYIHTHLLSQILVWTVLHLIVWIDLMKYCIKLMDITFHNDVIYGLFFQPLHLGMKHTENASCRWLSLLTMSSSNTS